jgi:hypothetical protein
VPVPPATDIHSKPVPNYGREGTRGPLAPEGRRVVVERFDDGGVTVWARAVSYRGTFAGQALVTLVLLSLVAASLTDGRFWNLPSVLPRFGRRGAVVLTLIVGTWLAMLFKTWRREKRGERSWDVVGIGPQTVYVDVEQRKRIRGGKFEVPRERLHDVRLTYWDDGTGHWAKSVEVLVDGQQPVDLCWGFNEAEIQDAFEALILCLGRGAGQVPRRGEP